jgi:putative endopeptidase
MKRFLLPLAIFSLMALMISCQSKVDSRKPDALVMHIDSTVKAGDDFFLYANGRWFKENPIPASETSNGLWQLIQDTINAQVRSICESSSALTNAEKGSNKQKIGDFFFSGMDSVGLNTRGIADLKSEFDMIDGIKDLKGVVKAAATIHMISGSPLFGFGVGQDDRISSKNAIFIYQGGLSLPDRRYYFDTDAGAVKIRQKFVDHLTNMFKIIGYDNAKAQQVAASHMKLETALAKAARKREDTRDPIKNYNKMSFKQLAASTPELDWALFMDASGLSNVDTVVVGQPEFLTALNG